jgi:hypothetical protein
MPGKITLGDQGAVERSAATCGCDRVQAAFDRDQAKGYVGERPARAWPRGPHELDSELPAAGLLALRRHRARWYFPELAG